MKVGVALKFCAHYVHQRRSDTINLYCRLRPFNEILLHSRDLGSYIWRNATWLSMGGWTELDMASIRYSDSDSSASSPPRAKDGAPESESSYILHLLSIGDIVKYTIPSFRFITVDLQHVTVVSDRIETDSRNHHYDIFLKHCPEVNLSVPCSIKVLDSGHISVSTNEV